MFENALKSLIFEEMSEARRAEVSNRTLMPPTFQVNEFTFIFMGRDWPINQAIMCSFEVIVAFTTYNSRGRFEVIPRPLRI